MLTSKQLNNAKYLKFIVGKWSLLKKWQTLTIIREVSYPNLETERCSRNSKISLRLSGRFDSTAYKVPGKLTTNFLY